MDAYLGISNGQIERVVKICERLGLPQEGMDLTKQGRDGLALAWASLMPHSHCGPLGLTRALSTS